MQYQLILIHGLNLGTGWHILLIQTSCWHQTKSSILAWPGQGRPGQYGTCLLMLTGGLNQGDVSPCTVLNSQNLPCFVFLWRNPPPLHSFYCGRHMCRLPRCCRPSCLRRSRWCWGRGRPRSCWWRRRRSGRAGWWRCAGASDWRRAFEGVASIQCCISIVTWGCEFSPRSIDDKGNLQAEESTFLS